MKKFPKIISHRGAANYAPENTLISLTRAKELGAHCVEFDVQLTADHVPVIFHDTKLNRTSNGKGYLNQHNYNELVALDAGSWFDKQFANEKIPTLDEYLKLAAKLKLDINIEIKEQLGVEKIMAAKIVKSIKSYWPSKLSRPLITSVHAPCLAEVKLLAPELPVGLVLGSLPRAWQTRWAELQCVSLTVNHRALTPKRVLQIKEVGYEVLAYTVNSKERAKQLFSWGVDAIFSDDPLLLSENKAER